MKSPNIRFFSILALILIIFLCLENYKGRFPQDSGYSIGDDNSLSEDLSKDKARPKDVPRKDGIIYNEQGKVKHIIKPIYDTIEKLDSNYFRIELNSKFGLAYNGEIILQPTYDSIGYFNNFLISFYPHILFKNIKIFYYWPIFYLSLLSIILLGILFIRYGDLSDLFYISDFRKAALQIYNIAVKTETLPMCLVLFLPWAILLEYSLWINTTVMFAVLVFIDALAKKVFCKPYTELKYNKAFTSPPPGENLFANKGLFFRKILYAKHGAKKYFLVRNFQGKWLIINKRLRVYGDYRFDDFIEQKDGIFIMKKAKDEYYVYMAGERPRVNRKIR
jgi:hypothetical protein